MEEVKATQSMTLQDVWKKVSTRATNDYYVRIYRAMSEYCRRTVHDGIVPPISTQTDLIRSAIQIPNNL